MAGLTAAHELAERGFDVVLLERRALGGKARSIPVPRTGAAGRRPLPGEHGLRLFFGFYNHLPDTMRRIPLPGQPDGAHGNLVDASAPLWPRSGGREDLDLAFVIPGRTGPLTVERIQRHLVAVLEHGSHLPPQDAAFLGRQLTIYLTSSDERRFGQWEHVSWWDFIRADRLSTESERISSSAMRNVALHPRIASARSAVNPIEAVIYAGMGRGSDGALYQVLNAPTNAALVDPWVAHLRSLGVRVRVGWVVEALETKAGRIVSARVRDRRGRPSSVAADWFVCALPMERARRLWTRPMLAADERLERMSGLRTVWGNGIQFYLRREVPVVSGQVSYVDAPWALTSISQAQFWGGPDFGRTYGDGEVLDCLSATIAEWDQPGVIYGKTARECTPEEIAREVWAQIKAHLEDTGDEYLPDPILHSWFLDPAISRAGARGRPRNDEPLFINAVGSWDDRPEATTAIPNLFLAGDYVRTNIDLTSMEGANEAARAAVIGLLAAAGAQAEPVSTYSLYRPPELEPFKRLDAERYRRGLPHVLDTPWPAR